MPLYPLPTSGVKNRFRSQAFLSLMFLYSFVSSNMAEKMAVYGIIFCTGPRSFNIFWNEKGTIPSQKADHDKSLYFNSVATTFKLHFYFSYEMLKTTYMED